MKREFIRLKSFDRDWADAGLDETAMENLEEILMRNMRLAPVVPGTGGIRKARIALPGSGKSGGARVFFLDIEAIAKLVFIVIIAKNEQENLSKAELNELAGLTTILKETLK